MGEAAFVDLLDPDEEALMRAANETYVLVDSAKYGHRCLTSFARLRDVDLTITDNNLSRSKAKLLEAAGATIQIVDPDGLLDSACECYDTIRKRYEAFLGGLQNE